MRQKPWERYLNNPTVIGGAVLGVIFAVYAAYSFAPTESSGPNTVNWSPGPAWDSSAQPAAEPDHHSSLYSSQPQEAQPVKKPEEKPSQNPPDKPQDPPKDSLADKISNPDEGGWSQAAQGGPRAFNSLPGLNNPNFVAAGGGSRSSVGAANSAAPAPSLRTSLASLPAARGPSTRLGAVPHAAGSPRASGGAAAGSRVPTGSAYNPANGNVGPASSVSANSAGATPLGAAPGPAPGALDAPLAAGQSPQLGGNGNGAAPPPPPFTKAQIKLQEKTALAAEKFYRTKVLYRPATQTLVPLELKRLRPLAVKVNRDITVLNLLNAQVLRTRKAACKKDAAVGDQLLQLSSLLKGSNPPKIDPESMIGRLKDASKNLRVGLRRITVLPTQCVFRRGGKDIHGIASDGQEQLQHALLASYNVGQEASLIGNDGNFTSLDSSIPRCHKALDTLKKRAAKDLERVDQDTSTGAPLPGTDILLPNARDGSDQITAMDKFTVSNLQRYPDDRKEVDSLHQHIDSAAQHAQNAVATLDGTSPAPQNPPQDLVVASREATQAHADLCDAYQSLKKLAPLAPAKVANQ